MLGKVSATYHAEVVAANPAANKLDALIATEVSSARLGTFVCCRKAHIVKPANTSLSSLLPDRNSPETVQRLRQGGSVGTTRLYQIERFFRAAARHEARLPAGFFVLTTNAHVFRDISEACGKKRAFAGKRYDDCSGGNTNARSRPTKAHDARLLQNDFKLLLDGLSQVRSNTSSSGGDVGDGPDHGATAMDLDANRL